LQLAVRREGALGKATDGNAGAGLAWEGDAEVVGRSVPVDVECCALRLSHK
jgi:hypothetical protein